MGLPHCAAHRAPVMVVNVISPSTTLALCCGSESNVDIGVHKSRRLMIFETFFGSEKKNVSAENSSEPQVVKPPVACYLEVHFHPLHRSALQYHLSPPVKAVQELPCRMQAAHPQRGASLGISTNMPTLPFPSASINVNV